MRGGDEGRRLGEEKETGESPKFKKGRGKMGEAQTASIQAGGLEDLKRPAGTPFKTPLPLAHLTNSTYARDFET